ncbi:unnamed protein product, partial [Candidula unifasciata]
SDRLAVSWQGPFKVLKKISDVDYQILYKGKPKIYHINMLKPYRQRVEKVQNTVVTPVSTAVDVACRLITEPEDDPPEEQIQTPTVSSQSSWKQIKISQTLPPPERAKLINLLEEFSDIFSDIPGKCTAIKHHIRLNTNKPIKVKQYPVPEQYREKLIDEIKMLEK